MSEPKPTPETVGEADIELANEFLRAQGSMQESGEDDEEDLVLAAMFDRVRAEEREACAKLCDAKQKALTLALREAPHGCAVASQLADAIRGRGET